MRAGGLVSEAFMSTMKTSLSEENELCLMAWARMVEKRKGHSKKSTLTHPSVGAFINERSPSDTS